MDLAHTSPDIAGDRGMPAAAGAAEPTPVARAIRRDIIAGRLAPGTKLRSVMLKAEYDAGASQLREALSHLAAEGLVSREARRGFRVAPVSLEDLQDITATRCHLDGLALGQSIGRGDAGWEADLVSAHHRLTRATESVDGQADDRSRNEDSWEACHRRFHAALAAGCGSPWLIRLCGQLYDHSERYRRTFWRYSQRAPGTGNEHDRIVEAVLARKADQAVACLEDHIRAQARRTANAMAAAVTGG